jgi:TatD DNase family protein
VRLVDSHCHLQADRFDVDVDLVVGGARLAGVERMLVPGWDRQSNEPQSARRAVSVAGRASASIRVTANVDGAA